MDVLVRGFAAELVKLASHEGNPSGMDIVKAEVGGPIPDIVEGFRRGGVWGGIKSGGAHLGGLAIGGLAGHGLAQGAKHLMGGWDPGIGPVRMSTVVPSIGAITAALYLARKARAAHAT